MDNGNTANNASNNAINNTMKIIIVVIVLAVIIGFILWLVNMGNQAANNANNNNGTNDTTAPATTDNNSATTETTTPSTSSEAPSSTVITYTGNAFSPNAMTVKAGATVTIKNDSTENLDFASDPHPVHTQNGELNVGDIGPGQSKTFTPTTKGSWGFHNHDKSGVTGKLTVE